MHVYNEMTYSLGDISTSLAKSETINAVVMSLIGRITPNGVMPCSRTSGSFSFGLNKIEDDVINNVPLQQPYGSTSKPTDQQYITESMSQNKIILFKN